MLLNSGVGEDLRVPWTARRSNRKSVLSVHWKDWCWSWNSNTLATWCEELTDLKRPWCWERLREAGEGDDRGWDGWRASPTQWTWVWVGSGNWWWTGRPGVLWFMGSQRVQHDWATELNWTLYFQIYELVIRFHKIYLIFVFVFIDKKTAYHWWKLIGMNFLLLVLPSAGKWWMSQLY